MVSQTLLWCAVWNMSIHFLHCYIKISSFIFHLMSFCPCKILLPLALVICKIFVHWVRQIFQIWAHIVHYILKNHIFDNISSENLKYCNFPSLQWKMQIFQNSYFSLKIYIFIKTNTLFIVRKFIPNIWIRITVLCLLAISEMKMVFYEKKKEKLASSAQNWITPGFFLEITTILQCMPYAYFLFHLIHYLNLFSIRLSSFF